MIWTALILGFAGSLHCVGMCSPLVSLVSGARSMQKRIVYNVGRIIPYALFGGVAGALGSVIYFSRLQFWAALGFGISLILIGVSGSVFRLPLITSFLAKMTSKIKSLFSFYLSKKKWAPLFFLGALNGFIPCGLTSIAASYCVLLPTTQDGVIFMIVFGLGTIPAMIVSPWVISNLSTHFSLNSKKIVAAAIIVLGCSIVARAALVNHPMPVKHNAPFSICE